MAKAIEVRDDLEMTIGRALLGKHGARRGSVRQQVHDGDTVFVEAAGNIGIRFLSIDTPEVSFRIPGSTRFVSISSDNWKAFLNQPFAREYEAFSIELPDLLRMHLESATGEDCAANHYRHARAAEAELEKMITADMEEMMQDTETFGFFLAFAFEVMDAYGRFLCYINRNQPNRFEPTPRPETYNERMLSGGWACPYFIWPNLNPWKKLDRIEDAVPKPGEAGKEAKKSASLTAARNAVVDARQHHRGIFDATEPLQLEPFELRMLARRSPPERWLIDLSSNNDELINPLEYPSVPHSEDRLWIPNHFVPLFVEKGWKKRLIRQDL